MKLALLLIDLQHDFLNYSPLFPAKEEIITKSAYLLEECRQREIPVFHIWTSVKKENDARMPHWKRAGKWICLEASEGHACPPSLQASEGEKIISKTFFSGFSNPELAPLLCQAGIDTLVVAGIYLHGCIRTTVLDAYEKGYQVWVAQDAVAGPDPIHSVITEQYLDQRAANFYSSAEIIAKISSQESSEERSRFQKLPAHSLHSLPQDKELSYIFHQSPCFSRDSSAGKGWSMPVCQDTQVELVTQVAQKVTYDWQKVSRKKRIEILKQMAFLLEENRESLVQEMIESLGKPISQCEAEMSRSIDLLHHIAEVARKEVFPLLSQGALWRYCPLGVVALITPWNNPIAIPIGKIAPALFYGNTVVWKPAPAGLPLAYRLHDLWQKAGCPAEVLSIISGDKSSSRTLMASENIDAITVSGSLALGYHASYLAMKRSLPYQAELGGNNSAIVWLDSDLEKAAQSITQSAFSFAGQRCTANRRVIIHQEQEEEFVALLVQKTRDLTWGDPFSPDTHTGPLLSLEAKKRVESLVERAKKEASVIIVPHKNEDHYHHLSSQDCYYPPTIIVMPNPKHEIVQEESFAPILIVQTVDSWEEALALANGVKHGLVASVYTQDLKRQESFCRYIKAGVLKINNAAAEVSADVPFGGWKASGFGPPEHGLANREFYTRMQSIYQEKDS